MTTHHVEYVKLIRVKSNLSLGLTFVEIKRRKNRKSLKMGNPQSKEPKASVKQKGRLKDSKLISSGNIFTEHNGQNFYLLIFFNVLSHCLATVTYSTAYRR